MYYVLPYNLVTHGYGKNNGFTFMLAHESPCSVLFHFHPFSLLSCHIQQHDIFGGRGAILDA